MGKSWRKRWRGKRGRSFRKEMETEVEGEEGEEVLGNRWRKRWRAKRGKKF